MVSITQENWSTEEVVLEELQVFKVSSTSPLKHKQTQVTDVADSFMIMNMILLLQVPTPILSMVMSSKKVCPPLNFSLNE